ncbi:hypothetical protein HNP50_000295 [Elizabethkingia anophelis]|nr:hypothetical protein [Elizabethkingia anophelis]MCW2465922.1 hypothetical protein [Elizabethkingia anophelis]MCW2469607.1 hypothetical protein [Elizabethkingia anophelis]
MKKILYDTENLKVRLMQFPFFVYIKSYLFMTLEE